MHEIAKRELIISKDFQPSFSDHSRHQAKPSRQTHPRILPSHESQAPAQGISLNYLATLILNNRGQKEGQIHQDPRARNSAEKLRNGNREA